MCINNYNLHIEFAMEQFATNWNSCFLHSSNGLKIVIFPDSCAFWDNDFFVMRSFYLTAYCPLAICFWVNCPNDSMPETIP